VLLGSSPCITMLSNLVSRNGNFAAIPGTEEKQQQKNMIALKLLEGIPLFAAAIPFIYYFQPIYGPLREQQQPSTSQEQEDVHCWFLDGFHSLGQAT